MGRAVFIGYRRDDSADVAGRLYDVLERHFGSKRVFKDVDSLNPGTDFGAHIRKLLPTCRVALILIGPSWLDLRNADGARRIDDPTDWVRIEIEAALAASDLVVVPVLLNGAQMPAVETLPPTMRALCRLHAHKIGRDPSFRDDVSALVRWIKRVPKARKVRANAGVLFWLARYLLLFLASSVVALVMFAAAIWQADGYIPQQQEVQVTATGAAMRPGIAVTQARVWMGARSEVAVEIATGDGAEVHGNGLGTLTSPLIAPVRAGQVVGEIRVVTERGTISRDLVASQSVGRASVLRRARFGLSQFGLASALLTEELRTPAEPDG